jgi:hypothetical protein
VVSIISSYGSVVYLGTMTKHTQLSQRAQYQVIPSYAIRMIMYFHGKKMIFLLDPKNFLF